MPTHYDVLGVRSTAEQEVIQAAYRALMRKYHPDTSGSSDARAKQINAAYAVLSDPERRRRYDAELGSQQSAGASQSSGSQRRAASPPPDPPSPPSSAKTGRKGRSQWYGLAAAIAVPLSIAAVASVRGGGVSKPATIAYQGEAPSESADASALLANQMAGAPAETLGSADQEAAASAASAEDQRDGDTWLLVEANDEGLAFVDLTSRVVQWNNVRAWKIRISSSSPNPVAYETEYFEVQCGGDIERTLSRSTFTSNGSIISQNKVYDTAYIQPGSPSAVARAYLCTGQVPPQKLTVRGYAQEVYRHVLTLSSSPTSNEAAVQDKTTPERSMPTASSQGGSLLCNNNTIKNFEDGPPYCAGSGGISGAWSSENSGWRPASQARVLCRNGEFQVLDDRQSYCAQQGGVAALK